MQPDGHIVIPSGSQQVNTVSRVLIVDDDDDLRGLLRVALGRSEKFSVVGEAGDGESALRLAVEARPNIVVLDLGLPDIAGHEVLSRLRTNLPDVRVVVFTGTEPDNRSSFHEWGADGVVIKGDHLSRLLSVLEDVAAKEFETVGVTLAHDPSSVRVARRLTADSLSGWGAKTLVEDAVLVVSELVTNAITHAESTCHLALHWSGQALRIEVTDFGLGSPEPQPQSTIRPGGRGLMIVSSVAAAWGIDPRPIGKVVWAELVP